MVPTTYIVTITKLCQPSPFTHCITLFLSLTVSLVFQNLICIRITKWSHLSWINPQMVKPPHSSRYQLLLTLSHQHILRRFLPPTLCQMVAVWNPYFSNQEVSICFSRNTILIPKDEGIAKCLVEMVAVA